MLQKGMTSGANLWRPFWPNSSTMKGAPQHWLGEGPINTSCNSALNLDGALNAMNMDISTGRGADKSTLAHSILDSALGAMNMDISTDQTKNIFDMQCYREAG